MNTATTILPAMRTAIRAATGLDEQLVPTLVIGHSGTFDFGALPRPAIVLAPLREDNPYPPVSRNAQKKIAVNVHVYTDFFGLEVGMLGDAYALGVMPLIDTLETVLDDNLLDGCVIAAHVVGKEYPLPADMNYVAAEIGLNEARLMVIYQTIDPALV